LIHLLIDVLLLAVGVLYGAHHGMQVDHLVHKPLWWFQNKVMKKSAKEWRW
jgi:hypothetical protein